MKNKRYGIVQWCLDDVIAAAAKNGVVMTQEQASDWWAENEAAFKNCMVHMGNEVLSDMNF